MPPRLWPTRWTRSAPGRPRRAGGPGGAGLRQRRDVGGERVVVEGVDAVEAGGPQVALEERASSTCWRRSRGSAAPGWRSDAGSPPSRWRSSARPAVDEPAGPDRGGHGQRDRLAGVARVGLRADGGLAPPPCTGPHARCEHRCNDRPRRTRKWWMPRFAVRLTTS